MKTLRGALFLAAAAAAVLVPLYGDPRQQPLTHPEWARMLLRALDMEAVLIPGSSASLAFGSLSWRTSLGLPTDRPFRSLGVELISGPPRFVRASAATPGEVAYRVAAPRPGDYRIRVRFGGRLAEAFPVELAREGESGTAKSVSMAPSTAVEEGSTQSVFDSGGVYLASGVYVLSLAVPPGLMLEQVEVVPPCVNSIEPFGGWQPAAVATTGDLAVTVLKALDLESELPPAATPVELPSVAFQPTTAQALKVSLSAETEGLWLQADNAGLQAVAHFTIEDPGLYTVYAFGLAGDGQSWVADACHKSVVCPTTEAPEAPRWRPILTAEFEAGRHSLAVTLANGAAIQRLRIERKKERIEDYLAALARLGLDLGEQRPATRGEAVDALELIKKQRATAASLCEDVTLPTERALVAGLRISGAPPAPPANIGTGTGPGPGGPLVPLPGPTSTPAPTPTPTPAPTPTPTPQPTPTPTPTPQPTPSPTPLPTPTPSPTPSIGPPPTTMPQPPMTPVKDE